MSERAYCLGCGIAWTMHTAGMRSVCRARTVVGIDGGLASLGLAVCIAAHDGDLVPIEIRGFSTKKAKRKTDARDDLARRLRDIAVFLSPYFEQASAVCVESLSLPRNASTASKLGAAFGVVVTVAERFSIPIVQATPQSVRSRILGHSRADKDEVHEALFELYPCLREAGSRINVGDRPHALDAVAVVTACRGRDELRAAMRAA